MGDNQKSIAYHPWRLIHEADSSKNDMRRQSGLFIRNVYDEPNIFILIEIKGQTVIGGYTEKGWRRDLHDSNACSADKNAFVFYLKSSANHQPFISNVKPEYAEQALWYATNYGQKVYGQFGHKNVFWFTVRGEFYQGQNWEQTGSYQSFKHGKTYLGGAQNKWHSKQTQFRFEVFQIDTLDNK